MDKNPESFQWLVVFVFQSIFLILLSQLNQSLGTVSLFLFLNGLLISFPALYLPLGQGMASVILLSVFYDSGESWSIGTSLFPNLLTFTIIYYARERIRYEKRSVYKPVILLANLALYVYYTILAGARFEFTSQFVFLNLMHMLVSQLVLLTVSGWLISYQKEVLQMFKVTVDATYRGAK